MFKIDLHTHSKSSKDGGISAEQYTVAINSGLLDFIAVTDHDRIDFAVNLHQDLGDKIIVGEEINSDEGEIIGLFLKKLVHPGLTAKETCQLIKKQGGLVYIPHPFETFRQGLSKQSLESIIDLVDIIEVHNGRAILQNRGPQAATLARLKNIRGVASSDAHGFSGLGTTYTTIKSTPTKEGLLKELDFARLNVKRPPLKSLLLPKLNRIKKRVKNG